MELVSEIIKEPKKIRDWLIEGETYILSITKDTKNLEKKSPTIRTLSDYI